MCCTNPGIDRLARWFGNFELNGPPSLLLHNYRPRRHDLSVVYIPYPQLTRSQARSLLSIARLNNASSRRRSASCQLTRIDQISFNLKGVFCPTIFPLFQGARTRRLQLICSMLDSLGYGVIKIAPRLTVARPEAGHRSRSERPIVRRRLRFERKWGATSSNANHWRL